LTFDKVSQGIIAGPDPKDQRQPPDGMSDDQDRRKNQANQNIQDSYRERPFFFDQAEKDGDELMAGHRYIRSLRLNRDRAKTGFFTKDF
jgi:hypothetical protein